MTIVKLFEILWRIGVILVPVTSLAGVFLLTAGTDETWILFGARGLVEHGHYAANSPVNGVLTTGGLYTILAALLHLIGDGRIEIIRLLSVASLAVLLLTLRHWALRFDIKGAQCWLVTAAPILVPGTIMLGAQAYGPVLALLLVSIGFMLWGEVEDRVWQRLMLVGFLLGTAAATRQDVMFALIAPLFAVLLARGGRQQLLNSLLVFIVGSAVFLFQYLLLWAISVNLLWDSGSYTDGNPMKIPFGYWIPQRLAFWSIWQSFMPLVLSVLITIGWHRVRLHISKPYGLDALLVFGWLVMLAWMFLSPIPHLRYLWPGLSAFAIVGMFALALLLKADTIRIGSISVLGIAILATGYLDGARSFLHGESDILSWQLSREASYNLDFGPFRHKQYQEAIVTRLLQIPADEPVATLGFNTSLSFLTRREIVPVQTYYADEEQGKNVVWKPAVSNPPIRPRWIVLTPMINHYKSARISYQLYDWIKSNCRVADRQGPYVLYEVIGAYPKKSDIFSPKQWAQSTP